MGCNGWRWLAALVLSLIVTAGASAQDAKSADANQSAERQALMAAMRGAVRAMKVAEVSNQRTVAAELVDEPVFRYSDEPRRIQDATMWVWTIGGRPVALMKLERYSYPEPERRWLFNIGSTSPGLVQVAWPFGHDFSSKKPGLDFLRLPDGPQAAGTKAARLIQIKQITRRFAATMLRNPARNVQDEMRLLPTPLYRYSSEREQILDGALFGLSATGTNPDAVIAIDLRGSNAATAQWHFAVAGTTDCALSVRLDDQQVWTQPSLIGRGNIFDTWTWFFSAQLE